MNLQEAKSRYQICEDDHADQPNAIYEWQESGYSVLARFKEFSHAEKFLVILLDEKTGGEMSRELHEKHLREQYEKTVIYSLEKMFPDFVVRRVRTKDKFYVLDRKTRQSSDLFPYPKRAEIQADGFLDSLKKTVLHSMNREGNLGKD